MATLCLNCGHALIFDPEIHKMHCVVCNSVFAAEDVESEEKKYRENERVLTRGEVYGDDEPYEEFLECYVYTCSQCGGEIVIHGSETSTKCVYCGNPNIVFSRISQEMAPDAILPFTISKDMAIQMIRDSISRSPLIPKEVRSFQPEDVRGIYIPYWVVNAEHEETCLLKSKVKRGKSTVTRYWGRTGKMEIKSFPLDGCRILSNESSSRLEPFPLKALKPFDEDYLLGFYSNASDINYDEMYEITEERALEFFQEEAFSTIEGSSKEVVSQVHETSIKNDYLYAMLPVWFVTFSYEGKHHTILVNGRSGKVVCGLPWRKTLFWAMVLVSGLILTVLSFFLFKGLFTGLLGVSSRRSSHNNGGKLIAAIVGGIVLLFSTGIVKLKKVIKQLSLTQSSKTFNFVKKRQE